MQIRTFALLLCLLAFRLDSSAQSADEIAGLKTRLAQQQKEIDELKSAVREQKELLEQLAGNRRVPASPTPPPAVTTLAATKLATTPPATTLADLSKKVESGFQNLGGFKFSGDFRYRLDVQARSANDITGPLQNVRGRYRVRMNVDKELDPRFRFHLQLSTGPSNNGITNDQDFGATIAKHPFSIAEAFVDFHPHPNFSMRGGRMEEVFADNMRFLWDDDVRFNGFHQIVKLPVSSNALGIKSIELRAGEYVLSNPAVYVVPQNSPYLAAGYRLGQKVRDANLFHPGFVIRGGLGPKWTHQFLGGIEIYRNPNQIQLASTANGFPVLVNNTLGFSLAGPMTASGNAVTTAGGATFTARNFQIAHLGYRLETKVGKKELPFYLDFQGARNVGTSKLRDAVMASANLGIVRHFGDMRFLYQFAIKDANSMISQFTDDDLGTGTGVNIAVHAFRFDLGLTRFLQWQNLLFIQNERRPNNPAENFFVTLQRGTNQTYRYLGQLAFTF